MLAASEPPGTLLLFLKEVSEPVPRDRTWAARAKAPCAPEDYLRLSPSSLKPIAREAARATNTKPRTISFAAQTRKKTRQTPSTNALIPALCLPSDRSLTHPLLAPTPLRLRDQRSVHLWARRLARTSIAIHRVACVPAQDADDRHRFRPAFLASSMRTLGSMVLTVASVLPTRYFRGIRTPA